MPKPTTLTAEIVAAHERLYPRVAALLKQVERVAGRRVGVGVPDETVALARKLCDEARRLLGREGRGIVPRVGSGKGAEFSSSGSTRGSRPRPQNGQNPDATGLALALGQAVAGLESFESEHSGWSATAKCTVWQLDGPPLPVARLLPPGHHGKPIETRNRESERARQDLTRLIMARYAAGYDDGYRDASEGKPPSAEYAERIWDGLVKRARHNDEVARLRELKRRYGSTTPPRHLIPEGAELSDPEERNRR